MRTRLIWITVALLAQGVGLRLFDLTDQPIDSRHASWRRHRCT
jgi:hypothetical protein